MITIETLELAYELVKKTEKIISEIRGKLYVPDEYSYLGSTYDMSSTVSFIWQSKNRDAMVIRSYPAELIAYALNTNDSQSIISYENENFQR